MKVLMSQLDNEQKCAEHYTESSFVKLSTILNNLKTVWWIGIQECSTIKTAKKIILKKIRRFSGIIRKFTIKLKTK